MILFQTSSAELFIKLHSSTMALMQECQDNILMKRSAVIFRAAAGRNVRALRKKIPIGSSVLRPFTHTTLTFLGKCSAAVTECPADKVLETAGAGEHSGSRH